MPQQQHWSTTERHSATGSDLSKPDAVPQQRVGTRMRSAWRAIAAEQAPARDPRERPAREPQKAVVNRIAYAPPPTRTETTSGTKTIIRGDLGLEAVNLQRRTDMRLPSLDRVPLFKRRPVVRAITLDAIAVLVAVLDVWLVIPEKAQPYSVVLSAVACAAMLLHRRFPFLAVLITVPGFFAGWAQLAAMIALGTLARRKQWVWQTMVGAGLILVSRYMLWPLEDYFAQNWREHVLAAMYGVLVAGMPVAIGLLVALRSQLSDRIRELAESREREQRLHEEAIRAAERASLAREMHDLVSHQVTLIAMQAGALVVSTQDDNSRNTAQTIRQLSTRTLDELRNLVGVLRSGGSEDLQPGLEALDKLVHDYDEPVDLTVRDLPEPLPTPISRAAYRTVQEALTNVRKHADGARAAVQVRTENDALVVEVRNEPPQRSGSRLASSAHDANGPMALPSGGHGLVGLRERAGMLNGTFEAGHTRDGGFLVRASYPLAVSKQGEKVGATR
jgi:signal transduction histidine kinase